MPATWIGCPVSINCGPALGSYQGKISEVTKTYLTLVKVYRNGKPYPHPEVSLKCSDIIKISLLDEKTTEQKTPKSTVTTPKPLAKRQQLTVSEALTSSHNRHERIKEQAAAAAATGTAVNMNLIDLSTAMTTKEEPGKIVDTKLTGKLNAQFKSNKAKKRDVKNAGRNAACFGETSDPGYTQDFDFEKNLALFDKQAIWNEINASQKPDLVRQADKQTQKFRHDENVIATLPATFRQISVKEIAAKEYVTDDGLIIPSISSTTRERLFFAAEKLGLSVERQIELMGRATTEISLQLLGGGHRLNPRNTHQFPTVVFLCGNHRQGAVAVNSARQLASHSVDTVVYCLNANVQLRNELALYTLTQHRTTSNVTDLPVADLIILALSSEDSSTDVDPLIVEWINENRAPVLAIDPPREGTFGVCTKISLVPVLPLAYSSENGRLYLCNLAIPNIVFNQVGIKYKSPFGPKFVIPLHLKDD